MLKKLLLPTLSFLFSMHAQAGYLAGAELSYKCLGGDSFLVTLKVYADCRDSSLGTTCLVKTTPMNCAGTTFNTILTQISVKDVTPVCSTSASLCNGGTVVGITIHSYSGIVNLSTFSNCCKFRVFYETSGRHLGISTGQANQNLCVQAILDKCITPCNNSPVFDDFPHFYLAAGQDQHISFSAVDTLDHDSLVFSLEEPIQYPGNPCTYSSGYHKQHPLMYIGSPNWMISLPAGFHLNNFTGLVEFRSTKIEYGVIVVKASEYRKINGITTLIGEVTRDLMMIVSTRLNSRASNLRGDSVYKACAGKQLCFKMHATDYDTSTGDSTRLFFRNGGIPGNTSFISTGTKTDTGTFCWTPDTGHVSTLPYYLTVTATDKGCPFNSYVSKVFAITVCNNDAISAQPSKTVNCRTVQFRSNVISAPHNLTYNWAGPGGFSSKDSMPVFTYAANGIYPFSVMITSPHNCDTFFYQDTVVINPAVKVQASADTIVCSGSVITLSADAAGGKAPFTYSWNNGLSNSRTFTAQLNSDKLYIVTMTDSTGCSHNDTLQAMVYKMTADAGADLMACLNNKPLLMTSGNPAGGSWSGPGISGNTFNPALTGPGTFRLYYSIQDTNSCLYRDSLNIKVNPSPVVNAGFDLHRCIQSSPITLAGNPAGGTWGGTGISGNKFDPAISGAGTFTVLYGYTDVYDCYNTDTLQINVIQKPIAGFAASPVSGSAPHVVNFTDSSKGSVVNWKWDFGDPGSGPNNSSSLQNPQHSYHSPGSYSVKLLASNKGCTDSLLLLNYISVSATGLQENGNMRLNLYPNPAAGDVTLSLENTKGEKFSLRIYDNLGKEIFCVPGFSENYVIKKDNLPAGVYHVRVSNDSGRVYRSTLVIE
jgi:hypothetical protein